MTPRGLHVSVVFCRPKGARNCGVSAGLLGGRVIRKSAIHERGQLECDSLGVLQWLCGHYEASVSGTLCVDDDFTSMLAWTGSGVLQKPTKEQIIGSSSPQRGPVPGLAEESRGERGLGQVRCT